MIGEAEAALGPAPTLTRADLRDVVVTATGVGLEGFTVDDFQVTGSFAGAPLFFEAAGEVLGRFAVPDLNKLSVDQVSLRMPYQVSRDAQTFDFVLVRPGELTADGLEVPGLIRAEGPADSL